MPALLDLQRDLRTARLTNIEATPASVVDGTPDAAAQPNRG